GSRAGAGLLEEPGVYGADDLHVSRQEPFEQVNRPALERLGQKRMIGIGRCLSDDVPSLVESDAVNIDEEPHELGHGDGRMGIVELTGALVGEVARILELLEMAPQQVLE